MERIAVKRPNSGPRGKHAIASPGTIYLEAVSKELVLWLQGQLWPLVFS